MVTTTGTRDLLANTLERTGTGSLLSATVGRWNGLVVFNYHRIGNAKESFLDRAIFSASQDEFDQQVRFLKRNFDIVGVEDLPRVLHDSSSQAVMITFDDGYLDNYEVAFPVLKEHKASALFFIASGFLDDHPIAWWDEVAWMVRTCKLSSLQWKEHFEEPFPLKSEPAIAEAICQLLLKLKSIPETEAADYLTQLGEITGTGRCPEDVVDTIWMSWEMVREMRRSGMDIGGHTVTHPVLANCSTEQQRHEIKQSKLRIEQELDEPVSAFSYPVGQPDSFTEETKQILAEAGYEWGFSFYGGYCPTSGFDPYDLKRMPVEKRVHRNLFRSIAKLPQLFAKK
ncbi:polysaccharide deacetylase family protein [Thalassoglobus sp.]|uniref:polysaccharide deacetylase family protein n=1 Tax=Thalassoglobus sp. TaxID=2795869 RepID=UPI003AA96F9E